MVGTLDASRGKETPPHQSHGWRLRRLRELTVGEDKAIWQVLTVTSTTQQQQSTQQVEYGCGAAC